MIVTLLQTIPSGSHNAPFSEELGHHWPAGQQFKVWPKSKISRISKGFRPSLRGKFVADQIGGEEVTIALEPSRAEELFGIEYR